MVSHSLSESVQHVLTADRLAQASYDEMQQLETDLAKRRAELDQLKATEVGDGFFAIGNVRADGSRH